MNTWLLILSATLAYFLWASYRVPEAAEADDEAMEAEVAD